MKLKFTIGNIASLFTVLIGVHIYISYIFIKGFLNSKGLESLPIITMEDLVFLLGFITRDILLLIFSGYIISLILEPLISSEKVGEIIQDIIKTLFKKAIKKNVLKIILLVIFSILVFIPVHFINGKLNSITELVMVLAVFVIPTLLIIIPKCKLLLTAVLFGFFWLWLHLFVHDVLEKIDLNEKQSNTEELSFEYSGKVFHTGNDVSVVFTGYKNMVFYIEKDKKYIIIPTDQIQNLTYKRKFISQIK